jgi:hypothetical protein
MFIENRGIKIGGKNSMPEIMAQPHARACAVAKLENRLIVIINYRADPRRIIYVGLINGQSLDLLRWVDGLVRLHLKTELESSVTGLKLLLVLMGQGVAVCTSQDERQPKSSKTENLLGAPAACCAVSLPGWRPIFVE